MYELKQINKKYEKMFVTNLIDIQKTANNNVRASLSSGKQKQI